MMDADVAILGGPSGQRLASCIGQVDSTVPESRMLCIVPFIR